MLFNSFVFVGFFLATYAAYLALRRHHRPQNLLLLLASYVFYGYWDWRFLSLLLLSTGLDFCIARALHRSQAPRRRAQLLWTSVIANLGLLGIFKYFNFFADGFADLLRLAGKAPDYATLHIVLPLGISFYTFQTLGYTIDVYRRRLTPADRLADYALYVAFFPQLVAGPIERAASLLPQITAPRRIRPEQINAGLWLILWGYYKKIVVADNLAALADPVFAAPDQYGGLDLALASLAFAGQIYGDFSGYSDIARGLAKLLGFDLMLNFRLPYLAANPREFWQHWHISLSSWLRDYLYIPLGGNRKGPLRTYLNLTATLLLGGLWHGAAWHFVAWGAYHAFLLSAHRLLGGLKHKPQLPRLVYILLTFLLVNLGWILFRAESLSQAMYILTHLGYDPTASTLDTAYRLVFFTFPLILMQLYQHTTNNLLAVLHLRLPSRIAIYSFLLISILLLGARHSTEFIYFQF